VAKRNHYIPIVTPQHPPALLQEGRGARSEAMPGKGEERFALMLVFLFPTT